MLNKTKRTQMQDRDKGRTEHMEPGTQKQNSKTTETGIKQRKGGRHSPGPRQYPHPKRPAPDGQQKTQTRAGGRGNRMEGLNQNKDTGQQNSPGTSPKHRAGTQSTRKTHMGRSTINVPQFKVSAKKFREAASLRGCPRPEDRPKSIVSKKQLQAQYEYDQ